MRVPVLAMVAAASMLGLAGCGSGPEDQALVRLSRTPTVAHDTPSGEVRTRVFAPRGEARVEVAQSALASAKSSSNAILRLSVFYPQPGQDSGGLCWQSVAVDTAGNVYPL